MLLVLLVQSYVIALIRRALFAMFRGVSGYLQTTSPRVGVDVIVPMVLSLQLLYLMLKVRKIAAAVTGPSTEERADSRNVIMEEDKRPNNEPTTEQEHPDDPV